MLSFRAGTCRFHFRVAAIVIDDGHLLLHQLEGDRFWALPGGRVRAGEPARDALVREFREELDLPVLCGALLCTGENFFECEGESLHEIGLYFAANLPATSPLLDKQRVHAGVEQHRALAFRWFRLGDLWRLDFRPAALKESLAAGSCVPHFVQHDTSGATMPPR